MYQAVSTPDFNFPTHVLHGDQGKLDQREPNGLRKGIYEGLTLTKQDMSLFFITLYLLLLYSFGIYQSNSPVGRNDTHNFID